MRPAAVSPSSAVTSRPTTSKPASTATCAMPAPMAPSPTTPIRSTAIPGRGAYTGVGRPLTLVVAAALDVVDPGVAPCEQCERPDDEEEDDECEFHGPTLPCGYY